METSTMSLMDYISECKLLFGAARYGWSVWEMEIAEQAWAEGLDVQEAVWEMNDCWVKRKADRNA